MRRLYNQKDLRERGIPFTLKHLIDLEKKGRFPRRVKFSPNGRNFWDAEEVDARLAMLAHGEAADATA